MFFISLSARVIPAPKGLLTLLIPFIELLTVFFLHQKFYLYFSEHFSIYYQQICHLFQSLN